MQQTRQLTPLTFARKLTATGANPAKNAASAVRRSDQPHEVDIREVTARATGHHRLSEGQPDTYAYRLMKQLSGIKTT